MEFKLQKKSIYFQTKLNSFQHFSLRRGRQAPFPYKTAIIHTYIHIHIEFNVVRATALFHLTEESLFLLIRLVLMAENRFNIPKRGKKFWREC